MFIIFDMLSIFDMYIYSLAKGDKRRPIYLLYLYMFFIFYYYASVALLNNFETFWHRKKRSIHLVTRLKE